ncbi:hypothetical protein IscW_ISCW022519 [Ixodes scapularis]|uniref:Uncharacterized protein n=1 Tax=Ixodes scapularis TaxID=6945 RepID=B7QG65_IXOSC|nr:hypothetical protein IscW_ISCW022519 [Ixodes scapularis]|eukprot:XP_002401223.1 hypothetical protein IscW_ISCW022519 [Ixodes scapularis]
MPDEQAASKRKPNIPHPSHLCTEQKPPTPLIFLVSLRLLPLPGPPTAGQRLNDENVSPTRFLLSMAHDKK